MILQLDCVYDKRRIDQFLGTVGRAELYGVFDYKIQRDESALVFDMGFPHGSEEWEYPKQVMRLLGKAHPSHPVFHIPQHILKQPCDLKVLLLAIEPVRGDILRHIDMGASAAKVIFQMIRSVAGMHDEGICHGGLQLNCWKISRADKVVLLDFGLMQTAGNPFAELGFGAWCMERDVRDLAGLAMDLLTRARTPGQSKVWPVLRNAACQGFGGSYPSARHLLDAFTSAAEVSAVPDHVGSHTDPWRLTREEVEELVRLFTLHSIAAVRASSSP